MHIVLRPAQARDFEYCAVLYFAEMDRIIGELQLDRAAHAASFRERWRVDEVRLIILDDADIGWLQSRAEGDTIFLAQIFVERRFQGRGIGTTVIQRLIADAADAGQAVSLGVVKTNPALRLYQRLGFRMTHEDARKFYMRREPG
jgi:GNAT superfamily N-acetyltransferase